MYVFTYRYKGNLQKNPILKWFFRDIKTCERQTTRLHRLREFTDYKTTQTTRLHMSGDYRALCVFMVIGFFLTSKKRLARYKIKYKTSL